MAATRCRPGCRGWGSRPNRPPSPLRPESRRRRAPSATSAASSGEVGRLGSALSTALRSHAATGAPSQAYIETAEQRADRRRTVNRHLTEKLGTISAEKRAALLEFNDESTQVQMGLQAALLNGSLSQPDYDAQLHQRIVVQLDQLRTLVTEDESRKLTGLEPGVDPYEYMRTGVGAAPGSEGAVAVSEEPPATER